MYPVRWTDESTLQGGREGGREGGGREEGRMEGGREGGIISEKVQPQRQTKS